MPEITRAEARALTRDLSGMYQTDINPDALINRFLAGAVTDMCSRGDLPFLRATLAATVPADGTELALPSGSRVRAVYATTGAGTPTVLRPVSAADLFAPTGSGPGTGYYEDRAAGKLRLVPVPVPVELRVDYDLRPEPFAGGDSATAAPVPAAYQEAVAYRAAAQLLAKEGEDAGRQKWLLGEYENYCALMLDDLMPSVDQSTVVFGADAGTRFGRRI